MRADETGRILREALDARARAAIGDDVRVPPMSALHRRRSFAWIAPLAVGVVVALAVAAVWLGRTTTSGHGTVAGPPVLPSATTHADSPSPASHPPSSAPPSMSGPPAKTVRVTSDLTDGEQVGVGEPIVLNFSPTPTDSSAFTKAVTVTVNGQPANGAWYWEKPYADEPVQAHYRDVGYWPANARIQVKLPIGGLSAGKGLVYGSALTSVTFTTGDAHISTVDAATYSMTVTDNGRVVRTMPVSLGASETPTYNGIKVVMQKGEDIPGTNQLRPDGTVLMSGPGYTGDPVPWSVRITASGEYVHAAGWNTHIGTRDTSNGCTNLKPADGEWSYHFSELGDVVKYVGTDGTLMNPLDGLGDWNVSWGLWQQGGLLRTH